MAIPSATEVTLFGHGLERMKVRIPVVGVPIRVIVVVLVVRGIVGGSDGFVVLLEVVVGHHSTVANQREVVDEPVGSCPYVLDESVDGGRVDALLFRCRDFP